MSEQNEADKPVIQQSVHHVITPAALVFYLDEEHREKAQECLRKSGKITISFREITVTKLPETLLQNGVLID